MISQSSVNLSVKDIQDYKAGSTVAVSARIMRLTSEVFIATQQVVILCLFRSDTRIVKIKAAETEIS